MSPRGHGGKGLKLLMIAVTESVPGGRPTEPVPGARCVTPGRGPGTTHPAAMASGAALEAGGGVGVGRICQGLRVINRARPRARPDQG